jgi:putative addiction module component (TIGR02574 family)
VSRRRAHATTSTIHIARPVDAVASRTGRRACQEAGWQCVSESAYIASATVCNPESHGGIRYTERDPAQDVDMPKPVSIPPPGFDQLTVEEQIDYVQSLWNRIAATPDQVPVPEWHRQVLDERLKDDEANPDAGQSWDVVRDRLRDKLRKP